MEDIITIVKCIEVVDNWGNTEIYKGQDLYDLLIDSEAWTDDQIFIGGDSNPGTYYIDDLIGKQVQVGLTKFFVKD
jgi:hypothetical protein